MPARRWADERVCFLLLLGCPSKIHAHGTSLHHQHKDEGFKHVGDLKEKQLEPMELLLRIFKDERPPKHPELGLPYMQLMTLRAAARKRLDGRRWDKVRRERIREK